MVSLSAKDIMLTAVQKGEVGYATNYHRRLRMAFLSGLKAAIVDTMVGVDAEAETIEELVQMAKNAEVLAGCGPASQNFAINATLAEPSEFDLAVEAVITRRFGAQRGRGGGSRGGACGGA